MARLSRHLGSLPLQTKHRINCIRTAIKRNMEVQNYAYAKQMLELLLSKAPASKQDELRSLIDMCVQRGLSNKSIDPLEDPSQFCAATLSRLSTIGYDVCDLCGAKFSALSAPGCIICGMGSIKRSDALAGPVPTPFGWCWTFAILLHYSIEFLSTVALCCRISSFGVMPLLLEPAFGECWSYFLPSREEDSGTNWYIV